MWGSVSIREKTKHFEKIWNCAISNLAQKKAFVKDKKEGRKWSDLVEPEILRFLEWHRYDVM